jgi:hypothetical protein
MAERFLRAQSPNAFIGSSSERPIATVGAVVVRMAAQDKSKHRRPH